MKNACIKVIITLFLMLIPVPGYSYTLKGEVTYTVERARKEAFSNVEYSLPKSIIRKNLKDPNFKENVKAIKLGATELKDRYIEHYSDGGYSILYKNNMLYVYYYLQNGKLDTIEKRESLLAPTQSFRYNIHGELKAISFILAADNTYIFKVNGELDSHWVGDKAYDKNGKVITIRY